MNIYALDYHRISPHVINELLCAWQDGQPLWTVKKGELVRAHVPRIVRVQHVMRRIEEHGISYKTVFTEGGRMRIRSMGAKCELLATWGSMRIFTEHARRVLYADVQRYLRCVSTTWYTTVPIQIYDWLIRL